MIIVVIGGLHLHWDRNQRWIKTPRKLENALTKAEILTVLVT